MFGCRCHCRCLCYCRICLFFFLFYYANVQLIKNMPKMRVSTLETLNELIIFEQSFPRKKIKKKNLAETMNWILVAKSKYEFIPFAFRIFGWKPGNNSMILKIPIMYHSSFKYISSVFLVFNKNWIVYSVVWIKCDVWCACMTASLDSLILRSFSIFSTFFCLFFFSACLICYWTPISLSRLFSLFI